MGTDGTVPMGIDVTVPMGRDGTVAKLEQIGLQQWGEMGQSEFN